MQRGLPLPAAQGRARPGGGSRVNYAEVKVWDLERQKEIRSHTWPHTFAGAVAFSRDGRIFAVKRTGLDSDVKLVDPQTGKTRSTIKLKGSGFLRDAFGDLAFSPDGRTLAIGMTRFGENTTRRSRTRTIELQGRIQLADINTGRRGSIIDGLPGPIRALTFTEDGSSVLVWAGPDLVYQASVESGQIKELQKPSGGAQPIAFAPAGRIAAAGRADGTVALLDPRTGVISHTLVSGNDQLRTTTVETLVVSVGGIVSMAFSPDGQTLASAGNDGSIGLWDAIAAVVKQRLNGHSRSVLSVALSPDGNTLVSGGGDGSVKVWEAKTGTLLKTQTGHTGPVNCVAFSPASNVFASASDDATLRLWDVRTGELKRSITQPNGPAKSVAFSPDGRTLASGGTDTIVLWDVATSAQLRVLRGHKGIINSLAFMPGGTTLLSAGSDATVKVWNYETGELKENLTKHTAAVNALAFSASGNILASGGDDKTIKIWETASWKLLRSLGGSEIAVYSLAFSPDGRMLASGSGNNSIVFWDAKTGEVKRLLRNPTR
jgi:WD40 repeat protein